MIGLLVALALSPYAQSLFGLDLESGVTRYRLLPLRGWEVLTAKDIAFLGLLFVLLLPLNPAPPGSDGDLRAAVCCPLGRSRLSVEWLSGLPSSSGNSL